MGVDEEGVGYLSNGQRQTSSFGETPVCRELDGWGIWKWSWKENRTENSKIMCKMKDLG